MPNTIQCATRRHACGISTAAVPGRPRFWACLVLWVLALGGLGGCQHLQTPDPASPPLLYQPQASGTAPDLVLRWAPAFLVYNPGQAYNRIGRPRAGLDTQGWERVEVDPDQPAIYHQETSFRTDRGAYANLVFRVHFAATPWSLLPFFIGSGQSMGLLVVLTLDSAGRPLLVTTLGTCGCYVASLPTDLLPPEALPADWSGRPLEVYGERLPARLDLGGLKNPRLVVTIRPGEHRVMDLAFREDGRLGTNRRQTPLAPDSDLERLPLPDGRVTSFFHQGGPLKGHVKGAWKPWETILLGIISLDGLVGMDKDYGPTGNPFYTSLKPWARQDSDLWDFPRFLKYWGWRL